MASGLVALLDDVAAIAKVAAASLDDVAAAAGKAGVKSAGIVIDDTAVTPRYVTGFSADRELPIIYKIALGSLRNKIVFLLPGCMLLSAFAPWLLTPLLMVGGTYLCFEAAEKLAEAWLGHHKEECAEEAARDDPAHIEDTKVSGAIRTDFILSAEIMAIALSDVADKPLWEQGLVLAIVGFVITAAVYGVVALIVKMDDIGLHMVENRRTAAAQALGRGLVKGMPKLLAALAVIGTAAMLWVGGGIVVHGLEVLGWGAIAHTIHDGATAIGGGGFVEWLVGATASGLFGLALGAVIVALLSFIPRRSKA
jgi:uncharacterized protein